MKWAASSLAGVGLAPALAAGQAIGRGSWPPGHGADVRTAGRPTAAGDGTDGLPPRAVGLRSLGGDFAFDPPGLALEPNSTLTWLNMGDFHTATAFHPANGKLLSGDVPLRIPEDAEPWHSGMLGLTGGTEYSHTFGVPGVYDYFCQPHYSFGMVGRVVVPPADGPPPRARPASELNEASREELPAVEAILGAAGRAFEWSARINGVLLLRAHGEEAGPPASRLAEAMAHDEELGGLLEREGQAARALSALEGFVEAVQAGAGYESLLAGADEAKAPLAAAAGA